MSASIKNTNLRMRPVYQWVTEGCPEEFILRLCQVVSFDPAVNIQSGARHAVLSIPAEARHMWSPILDIHVAESGDRTLVHARMGPAPQVWTLFVFLYAASAVPSMIGIVFGTVQISLGMPPWGLLALPAAVLFWGALYLTSFVGRGLGADQIHQLLAVLDATLVDAGEV